MSGIPEGLRRVGRRSPCPVCEKPDWCLVAEDGSRAICQRVESDRRVGEAGWLHQLGSVRSHRRRAPTIDVRSVGRDFGLYAAKARDFRRSDLPDDVSELSSLLGLSTTSLRRLGVGHNGWAWTFPMHDASGRVIGIRLRRPDGSKLAVKGSRQGLFIPESLDCSGIVLITEGPTDTAAALDLGFEAVGRPSCTGGVALLADLVRRHACRDVVVVADADEAGRRGAERLARSLAPFARLRVIEPPNAVKDLRAWLRSGASHAAVLEAIQQSSAVRIRVEVRP
jgi:hypothetical protein